MFKSSPFDKLLDKATSLNNLEPDWNSILQICDSIRQSDVQPKYALSAIKKKLNASNPNVELMALQVLESCVKNCGSVFHAEVACKAFMEEYHEILRGVADRKVQAEMLRLVQAWAHAFRNDPGYRAVADEMRLMKHEGFQFPVFKESDAMFDADSAPQWADGEVCHRCRTAFSMVVRKHHCRNCGQVFCGKCTAKNSTIPKYGIEKEVRVCDVCFDKLNKKTEPKDVDDSSKKATAATSKPSKKNDKEEELKKLQAQEEEELALALALSKSEAESKECERNVRGYMDSALPKATTSAPSGINNTAGKVKKSSRSSKSARTNGKTSQKSPNGYNFEAEDPELSRYLNREYWEQRATGVSSEYEQSPSPSAPQPSSIISNKTLKNVNISHQSQNVALKDGTVASEDKNEEELMQFANTLRSTIEVFMNRLNSNKLRGRPITNDHGVQAMFLNLTTQHANLLNHMSNTNEERTGCERLQDKISQIRDARAALDALREEHREHLRREAEEADRIRQQQMAQKLEILRKKKQEHQQYQQQIAMQRMQEQEREIMMKSEQFKFANNNQWSPMPPAVSVPYGAMEAPSSHPGVNYYPSNSNYPQQPAAMPQPVLNNHELNGHAYVQAAFPDAPHMVAVHQAPLANPSMPAQHAAPPVAQMSPYAAASPHHQAVPPPQPQHGGGFMPQPPPPPPGAMGAMPNQFAYNTAPPEPVQQQLAPKEEELLIKFE